jgi:dTDP-4-dehydrorhamnose reductase
MKILIAGGKGQLGSDFTQILRKNHDVLSVDLEDFDIALFSDVEKNVKGFVPDAIVNCAAYTAVDNCETEKKLAWDVNVKGSENLSRCAKRYGGCLIHISSDSTHR